MNDELIENFKKNIVSIGHLLWEKDLVSGLNGNISRRIDEDTILLTAHNTCLGLLQDKDILTMKLDGQLVGEGHVSAEKLLHTAIYKNFPETTAVIHTHTTYANAFFLQNTELVPRLFETKVYLGTVKSVEQLTPAVTDAKPVIAMLKSNNIAALRNHGVVAMGKDLFDCFLLVQALEEAAKIDCLSRLYRTTQGHTDAKPGGKTQKSSLNPIKKYKLFSKKQMETIVNLVNKDAQVKELGEKTNMTMDLAVKVNETGKTYSFCFQKGRIVKLGNDENAEFLITAPENIWRAVFNQEIDPFVATTQKKMDLRGDFAKISQWYAPCSRVFELWRQVPVE